MNSSVLCEMISTESPTGDWRHACPECGAIRYSRTTRYVRQCDAANPYPIWDGSCDHQGEEIREVRVKLCKGKASTRAVCSCSIHAECVILLPMPCKIKCCERCRDYTRGSESDFRLHSDTPASSEIPA